MHILIFLKHIDKKVITVMLTKLFKTQRKDTLEFSDDAWKDAFKSALSEIDKKEVIKDAKALFMDMKKDGSLEEMGKDVEFEQEG